ncbi:hypothetical protein ETB97_005764 [Aspergillus alliaceus]|uniref:Uncharacterized protein n=1 Tax=Petromyces alliaceus TaxID=209559 RepID=A0A8H6A032_PETAA|nr:hypothetical protein ETB97_005764 [Aspergillus burnettii]
MVITEPGSSSPESDKRPLVLLRSATPSDSSPSKALPEAPVESLSLPEWNTSKDSVAWFTQLRKVIKSIIYRYCSVLQKALEVFEVSNATAYSHYHSLQSFLQATWNRWLEFNQRKSITSSFLSSCIFHDDLLQCLSWMRTPHKASKRLLGEMATLRTSVRSLVNEMSSVRGLVNDALARLEEMNEGHDMVPFIDLRPPVAFNNLTPDATDATSSDIKEHRVLDDAPTGDNESSSSVGEDVDPDEQILAEGGIKDWEDLSANGFDPLWVEGNYPGDIPEVIAEYLGSEERNKSIQMVGSNRSIFWLFGLNDMVKVIDDPACLLQDEVVLVPLGTHPVGFLLNQYVYEQKIPGYIFKRYERFFTFPPPSFSSTVVAFPLFNIPSQVTNDITRRRIPALYPLYRPQTLPETVLCLNMKHRKSTEKLEAQLRNQLRDNLDPESGAFLFRGLARPAACLSMTFFLPVISSTSFDNEFGPGLYATHDLGIALDYAGLNGAVMVFKDTDFRGISVWNPDKEQWRILTASWLQIPLVDLQMPDEHKEADVIQGPLSADPSMAKKQKRFPNQGDKTQIACVSYESCKRLAASLIAIIYLTR